MRSKIVVFTDIDGTLVDTFTREYGKSKELVRRLKEATIPVILCSSKTRAEQDSIRKDLGIEDEPFIVENGGAIVIPQGYFQNYGSVGDNAGGSVDSGRGNIRVEGRFTIIELGIPSLEIRKVLHEVRDKTGISFSGVSDVSVEQLAEIVGMTFEEATNMSKRQYGETILEMDKSQEKHFEQILSQKGFKIIHGGRYFDVTSGNDKGKAVRMLASLFQKKMGNDTIFIGVGDSTNDLQMLGSTDVAILVQKHDGTWIDTENISGVIRVNGIGPAGWENAFAKIMELDAGHDDPATR